MGDVWLTPGVWLILVVLLSPHHSVSLRRPQSQHLKLTTSDNSVAARLERNRESYQRVYNFTRRPSLIRNWSQHQRTFSNKYYIFCSIWARGNLSPHLGNNLNCWQIPSASPSPTSPLTMLSVLVVLVVARTVVSVEFLLCQVCGCPDTLPDSHLSYDQCTGTCQGEPSIIFIKPGISHH